MAVSVKKRQRTVYMVSVVKSGGRKLYPFELSHVVEILNEYGGGVGNSTYDKVEADFRDAGQAELAADRVKDYLLE